VGEDKKEVFDAELADLAKSVKEKTQSKEVRKIFAYAEERCNETEGKIIKNGMLMFIICQYWSEA
jgi:hypothetical protein